MDQRLWPRVTRRDQQLVFFYTTVYYSRPTIDLAGVSILDDDITRQFGHGKAGWLTFELLN